MEVQLEMKKAKVLVSEISALLLIIVTIVIINYSKDTIRYDSLNSQEQQKSILDFALDSSVDAAVEHLVEQADNTKYSINKKVCIETFLHTMGIQLGISDVGVLQYVPVCAVIDYDGFWIYYPKTVVENGVYKVIRVWSEKYPYSWSSNGVTYTFTLGDDVTVFTSTGVYEGTREDLIEQGVTSITSDEEQFNLIKANAIVTLLKQEFQAKINAANRVANRVGITYKFSLPTMEDSQWIRAISDVSFIVLFQGFEYGDGAIYNQCSFGGARITKSRKYYVQTVDGIKYYHRQGCSYLTDTSEAYDGKKECAEHGAHPCPYCKP